MRISDWSSDVCSSDLAACGCNRLDCKKSRDNEPPARSWKPPASQRRHRIQTAPNTSVPFVPQKPKMFDITVRNVASVVREEERREGKECVSTCRSRGSPNH